ncbi:hypothetical protein [Sphingomonas sp. SORGH_AS_0742]|uniref:hypothetical protein n=1 Tax=Sphingomonas sp. SORGH_AS_0742 TaxID=3041797 RepID=UPI00286D0DDF|nr:hypothetical protein [Sphingomonas sp. SORGH_AS_0742]
MTSIDADAGGTVTMTPGTGSVLPQDMIDAATADAILQLDRKIARAIQTDRGINLKSEDLDLLTLVGAVKLIGEARSEILKEKAQCRHRKTSIAAANSTSIESVARTARLSARTSTSAGTIRSPAGCSGAARARLIFA